MKPSGYMGHRRAHLRFEVIGTITAALTATETLRVLNLGASGALVEGGLPLSPNAEYRMQLVLQDHVSDVTVKVRRVARSRLETGGMSYRMGLEFLALSPEAEDVINQVVVAAGAPGANEAQV